MDLIRGLYDYRRWVDRQHVVNHATHHRGEIAMMLTMLAGFPADTGLVQHIPATTSPR